MVNTDTTLIVRDVGDIYIPLHELTLTINTKKIGLLTFTFLREETRTPCGCYKAECLINNG